MPTQPFCLLPLWAFLTEEFINANFYSGAVKLEMAVEILAGRLKVGGEGKIGCFLRKSTRAIKS